MSAAVRNRLLVLGIVWGLILAAVPALIMARPYRLSGFLVAALLCAALGGAVGTLAAGRRAARAKRAPNALVAALGTGLVQGAVGGTVAAFLIWALMALTLSGFSLQNPVDVSALMRPQVFLGSFFVALSVFLYALAAGLVLGPASGALINRSVRAGKEGS